LYTIAVDAMGGDQAPLTVVEGALMAAKSSSRRFSILLVGKEDRIKSVLRYKKSANLPIDIVPVPEVIEMSEMPVDALKRKPNSSIAVCTRLMKEGRADAAVSAGNTGAFTASSILTLGKIPGVKRPTIGTIIPFRNGKFGFLADVGATADCRPIHLLQYGIMGSIFIEYILNRSNPKVGLLSIGEESSKGNELTLEAYRLMQSSFLNFIGNVEGRDILLGKADVVVCDGFVGNIILKHTETFLETFKEKLKRKIGRNPLALLGFLLLIPSFRKLKKEFDYQEYGGVPLLGINGVSIISHGGSSPRAIMNAIFTAHLIIKKRLNDHIRRKIIERYETKTDTSPVDDRGDGDSCS